MRVPDVPSTSLPIPERLVARLWERQHPLTLPLATTLGEEIQVVYPGRRRWDRGPDFTGALIARPGARLEHGEVEIHVRASDWRAHGHHRDRHYNSVILQVVMWDDRPDPTVREDGVIVPVLALSSHLSVSLEELQSAPEPDSPTPSPCRSGEGGGNLAGILDRCGLERYAAKRARFESDLTCHSADHLLYSGLATALGYSQNREPFRRLSELLPLELLLAYGAGAGGQATGDAERAPAPITQHPSPVQHSALSTQHSEPTAMEALLLGAAGLLPSQRGLGLEEGDADGYVRALEEYWAAQGSAWVGDPMPTAEWQFFRVRPANFPTRRVAALARLVDRWPPQGMLSILAGLASALSPRLLPRALERLLLETGSQGYWANHYDFGLPLRRPAHLIGRHRAAEVAVNVFLPLLAAWASHCGDDLLEQRTLEAYRLYPKRGDNEIARYVATQITGVRRPPVARSACRQQGLLHLYWAWCEDKRCVECPCAAGD